MSNGGFAVHASNAPRHISAFGIGAVVCGGLAFLLCWIPCVNMITIPLSIVGLLLALVGAVLSVTRKDTGLGLPIAGIALNGIALAIPTVILALFGLALNATGEARENIRKEKQQAIERSLSSGNEASPESRQPEKAIPGDWVQNGGPARISDVEVTVQSARIAQVNINRIGLDSKSEEPQLIVTLSLRNLGETRKIDFRTWRGRGVSFKRDDAGMEDEFGNVYKRISFGATTEVEGSANANSIYPGKTITEVLVFEVPIPKAKELRLDLPAENFGGEGSVKISIPIETVLGR